MKRRRLIKKALMIDRDKQKKPDVQKQKGRSRSVSRRNSRNAKLVNVREIMYNYLQKKNASGKRKWKNEQGSEGRRNEL